MSNKKSLLTKSGHLISTDLQDGALRDTSPPLPRVKGKVEGKIRSSENTGIEDLADFLNREFGVSKATIPKKLLKEEN